MFVNLTPHDVQIFDSRMCSVTIPPTGLARVEEDIRPGRDDLGIQCVIKNYGRVTGIPAPVDGVIYVVSVLVFAATDRLDVVCPDSGPDSAIRDENGRIVGVKRFMSKV